METLHSNDCCFSVTQQAEGAESIVNFLTAAKEFAVATG